MFWVTGDSGSQAAVEKVCFWSVTQLCLTLCDSIDCSMPGFPVLYLLEFVQTHVIHVMSVMPSKQLILSHPLLFLPSIFPRESLHVSFAEVLSLAHSILHSADQE